MFLNLENKLSRSDFEGIIPELGIIYSERTIGNNTYYRQSDGETVTINFGGLNENDPNTFYATHLVIDNSPKSLITSYTAMKNTVLSLGMHISIATISGDYIDKIHGSGCVKYSPKVFDIIDQRWEEIENADKKHCDELARQSAVLPKPFNPENN